MLPLQIDPHIDVIREALARHRAAVVTAAPGAGKTTRVPPALVDAGAVILLQPRRVAARAIAVRIAEERGWTVGREVGWQIRLDRRYGPDTRLLVVTEGILTARLQTDPLLAGFSTIVVDEFHERSVHADLALTLARQAWRTRADLRIVVMSATLDAAPVAAFLDGCPIVEVPGIAHPIEVSYEPGRLVSDCAREVVRVAAANVLCFLPGAAEIRRTVEELTGRAALVAGVEVVPLHGSLDAEMQDTALRPSDRRRIIVATNIAETSLTVPGVAAVVDSGLHKVARWDVDRGIDTLVTERIPADAADQRAGRAGRLGPGIVRRLWDSRDRLRPHREPEIHRVDLSGPVLDVIAWGGDPRTLEWFERPRGDAIEAALDLLERLDIIRRAGPSGPAELTPVGRAVHRLPLHPRLARLLVAAGGARDMARACAILSEARFVPPRTAATTSDLLSAIDRWSVMPPHVHDVASDIERLARREADQSPAILNETDFRRALLAGYPDRVAKRRNARTPDVLLASGAGARVAPESGVVDGEFLLAHDVRAGGDSTRGPGRAPRGARAAPSLPAIRLATRVEREWLTPTSSDVVHVFDESSGTVRARRVDKYGGIVLAEHPLAPDPQVAEPLLADAWLRRGPDADDQRLLRRLRFAGREVEVPELVRRAAKGASTLADIAIARALPAASTRDLERLAPDVFVLPRGRRVRLEYGDDGTVTAASRLQDFFGLAETPRIGRDKVPLTISLLAPNGRPVQVTRDLRSFWERTYPEVRKELRGRYPKHAWPVI